MMKKLENIEIQEALDGTMAFRGEGWSCRRVRICSFLGKLEEKVRMSTEAVDRLVDGNGGTK